MRVLLADDHPVVRNGLRRLLNRDLGFEVVGEACTVRETVKLVDAVHPDVLLLDLSLQGGSSLSMVREFASRTKVLAFTMHDEPAYVQRVLGSGGRGYVLKEASDAELLAALRAVAEGKTYVYPTVVAKLLQTLSRTNGGGIKLSPRETEVLSLVALGYSQREIAGLLGVGVRTVETYRNRLSEKLQLRTRPEMVRYARAEGLV